MKDIKTINEWILVKPDKTPNKEAVSPGGIVLPTEASKEVVKRALVVQISPDIKEELHYKVGDTVLYFGKTGIPINNEEYMFLKFDGMLAIEAKDETN